MPADRTRNTLARQWELLKLLPSRGVGKTARELTEQLVDAGFEVSKRQTERDLGNLIEAFPIECNDAGVPYGWRWAPGTSADLPGITLAEALSLRIVEDSLRPLLPTAVLEVMEPRFRQALDKLSALGDTVPLARWKDKVRVASPTLPLLPPQIALDVLDTVQSALLKGRQLQVRYQGVSGDESIELILHPLAVVQRGPATYLVANAFSYQDVRLYALQRIQAAEVLAELTKPPPDFDLDTYLAEGAMQFGHPKRIRIRLRVEEYLVRILAETPLSEDQRISEKGDVRYLEATVTDSWQLRWWLLAQEAGVEVLGPKVLRNEIARSLQAAACQYALSDTPQK